MNNHELDKLLKSVPVPGRDAEHWQDFPRAVVNAVRADRGEPLRGESRWLPRLAWASAIAAICLVVGFAIGRHQPRTETTHSYALLQNGMAIREVLTLFPNRVRAIIQDEQGMRLVLSDEADVPASAPIYVRICDGKTCASLVTFSGQELELDGQHVSVLSDARGGVIVAGNRFAWSTEKPAQAEAGYKIEARMLKPVVL